MTVHDASASALGYLFQVKWALAELLSGMVTRPEQSLTLESLDDVAWESAAADATELMQLKHHANGQGDLTDYSDDLWRTLRVWMSNPRFLDAEGPILSIVTTAVAPQGSASSKLRPAGRCVAEAVNLIDSAAEKSTNKNTAAARAQWLKLEPVLRLQLADRIRVLDGSGSIHDVDEVVRGRMMAGLPFGHEDLYLQLLWGWWLGVSIDLLAKRRTAIDGLTVRAYISELRDKFRSDDLVTTVHSKAFDDVALMDIHADRLFVKQLGWVGTRPVLVQKAVLDYHRAVAQTTDWVDGTLIDMAELELFRERLEDEWETAFEDMLATLSASAPDEEKEAAGLRLYQLLRDSTNVQIRAKYRDQFYARGVRHQISDDGQFGWHPEFEELVKSVTLDKDVQ